MAGVGRRRIGVGGLHVLYLLLILLLTFLIMAAVLWGATQFVQGALYEEPPSELYCRAPAAAGVVTGFLAIWCLLNYLASEPDQSEWPYDGLFSITSSEKLSEPVREFSAVKGSEKVHYRLHTYAGLPPRFDYRDSENALWRSRDVEAIVLKEGDREVRFNAETDKARFVEEGGPRYISEETFGRITTPGTGRSAFGIILNFVHLGVWFASIWLLLRFQWPHALLIAFIIWAVMTFVVPTIFDKVPRKEAPAEYSVISILRHDADRVDEDHRPQPEGVQR